jgi:ribonuclease G
LSNELLFSRVGGRTIAVLREDGVTTELRVEDDDAGLAAGHIVKARVSKILPGIQAAFLDAGHERDAFLHVADLLLPGETLPDDPGEGPVDSEPEDDAEGWLPATGRRPRRGSVAGAPIQDRLKVGRELIIQVAREGIGGKGPRVTCHATLPGRYLVYAPQAAFRAVSRRIADPGERERLRAIVEALPHPSGGFIVRTAGAGASASAFEADAWRLAQTWREIEGAAAREPSPSVLYRDLGLFRRTLRDTAAESVERIVVDQEELLLEGRAYLADLDPSFASRLVRHVGEEPLFDATGVTQDLEKALRPRVWLKSGGTLVVEQTEALVSIDVNTGKFVGTRHPEETVLKTNLEAAVEIPRQLRLRDLGGIIVIDFIDMDDPAHRSEVIDTLQRALRRDRARTKVVGLSELGLLQLTRKRTRPGIGTALTRACATCGGSGRIKTPETVARDALREVCRVASSFSKATLTVTAHPDVARALRHVVQVAGPVLDRSVAGRLEVNDDEGARFDQFDVSAV